MTTKNRKAARKTTTTKRPTTKRDAKPAASKPARASMWGAARELIKAGKTNAEILAILRERFSLPQHHSFYPVWYRSYAIRHGVVTKDFARKHAGPPLARKPATA